MMPDSCPARVTATAGTCLAWARQCLCFLRHTAPELTACAVHQPCCKVLLSATLVRRQPMAKDSPLLPPGWMGRTTVAVLPSRTARGRWLVLTLRHHDLIPAPDGRTLLCRLRPNLQAPTHPHAYVWMPSGLACVRALTGV